MLHGNNSAPSESAEEAAAAASLHMVIFAKLIRALTRAVERLAPARSGTLYRPEKHYMRGAGPKSEKPGTRSRTTRTT